MSFDDQVLLPSHGPIVCRECWSGLDGKDEFVSEDKRFKLVNDPAAWGSRDPKILVLGITKGNTQSEAMKRANFDEVAYKNFRPRLTAVLHAVGLARGVGNVSEMIRSDERAYGWGSVVRCSLTGLNRRENIYTGESGYVLPAFRDRKMGSVISNCFSRYLSKLPTRVELIVLLGNSDQYIASMRELVSRFYKQDFQSEGGPESVSYKAGGRLWVHVGHPSPGNGWFNQFISGDPSSGQGKKRELARRAIEAAGIAARL